MDEHEETTENFELLLQQPAPNHYSRLYSVLKSKNSSNCEQKCEITAQDVLSTVVKQIKMLQTSESVKSDKKPTLNGYRSKQSSFVPVNMLPREVEPLPQKAKFDTQLCTDTELINVIDNAENNALDMNCGMTQEFETSFYQRGVSECCDAPETSSKHYEFPVLDISLKGPNLNNSLTLNFSPKHTSEVDNIKTNEQVKEDEKVVNEDENTERVEAIEPCHDNAVVEIDTQFDNCTEFVNQCKEIEDMVELNDLSLPSSPILAIKPKRNKPLSSPLTFDLETFENFENIAQPIIEHTPEFEVAKKLINSQIFGKELRLQVDSEPFFDATDQISPILELNNEVFKIDKDLLANNTHFDEKLATDSKNSSKSDKTSDKFLKDEILFSSDEDVDYEHKSYQDLPFTCALETSFYNQSDVLEKTMYVGFQTANNRSIQISTESFSKARSLFDDIEDNLNNDPTISQLVKICDSNFSVTPEIKLKENVINDIKLSEDNNNENKEKFQVTLSKIIKDVDDFNTNEYKLSGMDMSTDNFENNVVLKSVDVVDNRGEDSLDTSISLKDTRTPVLKMLDKDAQSHFEEIYDSKMAENNFVDFKTASNKNFKLSDKAMARSKTVFQDIFAKNLSSNSDKNKEKELKAHYDQETQKTELIEDVDMFDEEKIDEEIIKEFEEDIPHSQFKEQVNVSDITNSGNIDIRNKQVPKEVMNTKKFENDKKTSEVAHDDNIKASDIKHQLNIGFKTASNKNISITKRGLATIKNVFKDIDFGSNFPSDGDTVDAKQDICDKSHMNKDCSNVVINNIDSPSTSKAFVGFRTANNKEIKISEKALEKSKNILQDIDTNFPMETGQEINSKEIIIGGGKTYRDKNICVLEKSIKNSKCEEVQIIDIDEKSSDVEPPFYGFEHTEDDYLFEELLVKSEKIFEKLGEPIKNDNMELYQSKNDINNEKKVPVFAGFQTASKKPVKISAEALAKTKNIFKGIDNFNEETVNDQLDEADTKSGEFVGFKTANNKPVKITEDALLKTKNIFKDINIQNEKKGPVTTFVGFKTANNNKIDISKEALSKSRKILQEFSLQPASKKISEENVSKEELEDIHFQTNKIESNRQFIGFQTANNKEIKVSSEALAKTRQMFKDFDVETEILNKGNKYMGFQTASNKKVEISNDALAKSRLVFQEFDAELMKPGNNDLKFGFQTASDKEVSISNEALAKSRQMLKETNIDTINLHQHSFKGFQTANYKEVKVSEEALAKSKKILQEIDIDIENPKTDFTGFKTASNKKVAISANNKKVVISETALARSRQILQDITKDSYELAQSKKIFEEKDIFTEKPDPKTNFTGFQTANNKKVIISETALARSRQILEDINKDNKETPIEELGKNLDFGFKTGNENKITFSKESLAKSKQLFTEFNTKTNTDDTNIRNINLRTSNTKIDNLESIMNTQVIDNFEETLHTEDFLKEETPKKSKRSGSPILSCPKAKKRKIFQTPYSQKLVEEKVKDKPTFVPPQAVQYIEKVTFNSYYKKHKQYTLKDLKTIENTSKNKREIDPYILNFNFNNLLNFKFNGVRNDLNLPQANNQKQSLNIEYMKTLFLNAINKKLIPDNWIDLQLKQIIWKLISYEIYFPKTMSYVCTARNIIEQLKYRYDKELYNAERPALRKIMERDDISMKTLCLCVVDIVCGEDGTIELLLSDGWYCIKTVIDKMLSDFVKNGKLVIGTKLMTQGSELMGNEQPLSPWEDTSTIRLKIFGNSTRRAHWSARLGYHGNAAILTQLSNVSQIGGKVSKVRVFVSRVYPALYVEKFEDGSTVTRSERLETIHQMKYENERQMLLEKIYEDVEKEICNEDSQDSIASVNSNKRKHFDTGSQIAKMMKKSKNPNEFKETLTSTQHSLLNNYTALERDRLIQRLEERVREKIASSALSVNRNVVTLLKIRICDFGVKDDNVVGNKAMLSIWKPNDAIIEMLKEGTWIDILNVVPTSMRYSEIQLSAGRQSVFSLSKQKENEKITPFLLSLKRTCYLIKDLIINPTMTTDYNEIDTAGIVFLIDPDLKEFDSRKHQFQNVYLSDIEKNIICVNFWGGLKKFGFENVLDTGQIVAGINLQKRAGNTRKSIPQYRVTEFSYFTKTPKNDSARTIVDNLNKSFSKIDRKQFIEECIALKSNYALKLQGFENISPYRFMNIDANLSKNKMFLDSPLAQKNKIEDNLNLTGLDFESTFKQSETQELSPKTLLRKKQVQQKIAKLKMYGEPPPLSPIQIINKSKNAGSAYKSPLIANSDVSPSVASGNKNLPTWKENDEITCSPVISMNRTFLKRTNVNPVKLNFSNNNKNESSVSEVDEFAEDFDPSPPLSLE